MNKPLRIAALAGMVSVLGAGVMILGNSRRVEGPAMGGVTAAAVAEAESAATEAQAAPVTAEVVSRRDLRQILELAGSLRSDEDVTIGARMAGKVVQVLAKEGDRVARGQVLVRLDDRELRAQLSRAYATLRAGEAKLSLARNQATWKDSTAQADHRKAQAALRVARARLQQAETEAKLIDVESATRVETAESGVRAASQRLAIVQDSTRKQDLRQAQLGVDLANEELAQARIDLTNSRQVAARRQALLKQDAIAREEVEEAERRARSMEATVKVAEAAVTAAQQRLELAAEGSRPEEIRIAQGQHMAAERALNLAKSDIRKKDVAAEEVGAARSAVLQAEAAVRAAEAGLVQTKMSEDDVSGARAAIQQARGDIQFYTTQLEDLTIRAPVSGVVSTRQVNVGETVTQNSALMNLVALEAVYLEAQAPELEVGLLRPGASTEVTVDALPGRKLSGTVREIIPVAERSNKSFRVRIAVPGGGKLPAGGYARARVHVGLRPNAVSVSRDAVHTESGDKFVWLIAPGKNGRPTAQRQPVKVGLADDRSIEILEGLKPGQRIVAGGARFIVEGAALAVSGG